MTKKYISTIILLSAALAIGFVGPSTQAGGEKSMWKKFLPKNVFKELVSREVGIVKKHIGTKDFETARRARVAALMIAGYTLSAKDGDAKNLKAIRNTALRLAEVLGEEGKADEARKLADALASFKGVPAVKGQSQNFKMYVNNDYYLMVPYMPKKKGGDGLHKGLQFSSRLRGSQEYIENLFSYLGKRPLRDRFLDKAAKEIELAGYRTAVSGELIAAYQPTRKSKKRDPAVWKVASKEMIDNALRLAHAAEKKDAVGVQKAADGVLQSCVRCHKVFQ